MRRKGSPSSYPFREGVQGMLTVFIFYFVSNYLARRNPRIFSHYLCQVVPAPTNFTVQVPRPSSLADIQGTATFFFTNSAKPGKLFLLAARRSFQRR